MLKSECGQERNREGFILVTQTAERKQFRIFFEGILVLIVAQFFAVWSLCVWFVCFPAALCSDNLPRCPTFLFTGSFTHSTRKWISEMWWRLKAPLIAWSTSCVLPKCMNLSPSLQTENMFIDVVRRGLNSSEKFSSNSHAEVHVYCPRLESSRPWPSCYAAHRADTHRSEHWPDCVPYMSCPEGGCGGWGGLVLLAKVSRGSAAPGPGGRCLVWDGCWLMSLVSPSVFFFLCKKVIVD